MRSKVLARVVSTILIGTAVASPTAPSLNPLDKRCLEVARGCDPHNVLHHEPVCENSEGCQRVPIHYEKRCFGQHCVDRQCSEGKTCDYPREPNVLPPPPFLLQKGKVYHHEEPSHKKESHFKEPSHEKESHHKEPSHEKESHHKEPSHEKESHVQESNHEKECKSKCCHHEKESCERESKCEGKNREHGEVCDEKSQEKFQKPAEVEYRGYKCGTKYYPQSQLQKAASSGCELLNKKKQLRFSKYPMSYSPSAGEQVDWPANAVQPAGSYFVYPIQQKDKVSRIFGHYGPDMVLLTKDCKVAGAVVEKKTSVCPKEKWCFKKLFNKPNVYYATCYVDHNHHDKYHH